MKITVNARRQPWTDAIELAVIARDEQGVSVGTLQMARIDAGQQIEPTLRLANDTAQYLMDELWRCGLRPTEGSGSAGALAATERHLADMRQIALANVAGLTAMHAMPAAVEGATCR
jgi:hypothetical protein